ncbi:hypothetical protein LSAT2_029855, partial [Lamellibrachia satsuma]
SSAESRAEERVGKTLFGMETIGGKRADRRSHEAFGSRGRVWGSIVDVVTKRVGFVERLYKLTASMLTFKPDDYPAFQLGKPRFDQV